MTVRTTDTAFLNVVFIRLPFKLVVTLRFPFGSLLQTRQSPLRHKKNLKNIPLTCFVGSEATIYTEIEFYVQVCRYTVFSSG